MDSSSEIEETPVGSFLHDDDDDEDAVVLSERLDVDVDPDVANDDNDDRESLLPRNHLSSRSPSQSPFQPMPSLVGFEQNTAPMMDGTAEAIVAAAAAVAGLSRSPVSEPDSEANSRTRKRSSPGTTTARQKDKSKKRKDGSTTGSRITPGKRVKVRKKEFFQLCSIEAQHFIKNYNENYNFYGNVISGSGNKGWKIEFDLLPVDHKQVVVARKKIALVAVGDEEAPYDKAGDIERYLSTTSTKKKKKQQSSFQQSDGAFRALSEEDQAKATVFNMHWNKDNEDPLVWKIYKDNEYITRQEDPCSYPDGVQFKEELDFINRDLATTLFEDFFPSITGMALRMDEYYEDIRAPYYQTVVKEGIRFHRADDEDPDWVVKNCFLLLLAAAGEVKLGIDNLWKSGPCPGGRRDYADFKRYVPVHYFTAWKSAMPLMWCDRSFWYEEKRNLTWEVFKPMLKGYNEKRMELLVSWMVVLDESMSGWRPKTSKLGGLPNITFEPRKPVPLGTQLRNAAECYTGILVFQDIVQAPEQQAKKDFFYDDIDNEIPRRTSLPGSPPTQAHVAEVLRQCKGANVLKGGWVGGDAWFGSIMSCVELFKEFGVYSTFILKGHTYMYPYTALHSVLVARHGDRPAGHWVTMTTTIADVKVIAIAYAWSQKGISYFVSTCGSTEPSSQKYQSKFEDEWGNTQVKMIERPAICHFLYQYLPLIDEHNKQRQSLLALEKRWHTQDVWFRLACTMLGMAVVDMHRCYRYYEIKEMGKTYEEIDSLRIIEYSDQVCSSLRLWPYKQARRVPLGDAQQQPLCRITNSDGNTHRDLTDNEARKGKTLGAPVVLTCFVCRRYVKDGRNIQQQTSFWCSKCHMPLCRQDRSDGNKRTMSCLSEHLEAEDVDLKCHGIHHRSKACPPRLYISLDNRKSKRKIA
jgi:Transposase IS4